MAKPLVNYAPVQLVLTGGSASFTPTATQGAGITWTASNLPTGASVNSSTGEITGTLSTHGKWVAELVATNVDGEFRLWVPFIVYDSVVTIDAAWLADSANQHDSGYKIVGGSYKIFRLDQDVTSSKTAFWIADDNIYLDLNGYTIHYGSGSGAYDYGVAIYTSAFHSATTFFSPAATTTISGASTSPTDCAVFNGSIVNDGAGSRSHAIDSHRTYGILIAELETFTEGKDSCAYYTYQSGFGTAVLVNNILECNLTDTYNRHAGPACVQVNGTVNAENNLLIGQNSGFSSPNSNGSGSIYRRNAISHDGAYTNGYGIWLYQTSSVEAYDNVITPTNGRGILVNGPISNGSYTDNLILHMEEANVEFGSNLNPPAYRIRYGTQGNYFARNTTLGIAGGIHCGASSLYITTYGTTSDPDICEDNHCTTIVAGTPSITKYANPITFEGTGGASDATADGIVDVRNNTLRSNCYMLRTEGYDGFTQQLTEPSGNLFEWVEGDEALADFFDAVDAKLLELGLKASVLAAAQDRRDVVYAIADSIAGVTLHSGKAFWFVKFISHSGRQSYLDILDNTYGAGVDPETYTYEYSALSWGTARYREGETAEIEVLLAGNPVANTELTVTTPQGDEYTVETDGDGLATFKLFNFAIEKTGDASGQPFSLTARTFSTVTLGSDSAIIYHSSVPATITLEATPPTPPINTVAPEASGSPVVGDTLSCTNGTWDNSPDTYAYQWYRNTTSGVGGTAIAGATSATYDLTEDEVGLYVYCAVTAANEDGEATTYSNSLGLVQLASSYMTISHIASTSKGSSGGSTVTTDSIDTTGADLLVAVVSYYGNTTDPVLSDSKGNTWTGLTAREQSGVTFSNRIYYCKPTSVGSGHTFTAGPGGTSYPTISVSAFSGTKTSSVFDQESGAATAGNVTSFQPGSITPSEDGCLLVTGVSTDGTSHSINSSFNATATDKLTGNHLGGGIAYKIQTTAAAENPMWSWTGSSSKAAAMASFKPAPPPAPANSVAPAVIGLEVEGETLETDNGTWTDASSYSYKWFRNASESTSGGTEISGATSTTYDLTASDVDKYIYSEVTATNITGSTSAFSNIVGPIEAAEVPPGASSNGPVFSPVLSPVNPPLTLLKALGLV